MKFDNRAIGVFDSGIGGLTVVASIKRLLPDEKIVYFGDLLHLPYGSKSKGALLSFAMAAVQFLISQDIKLLVIACNTATSIAKRVIENKISIPVIGVVEPGASTACNATKNKRVGVIGTQRTIESNAYRESILKIDPNVSVFQKSTPLLVPLIEEGWIGHPVLNMVLEEYFKDFNGKEIDTIVLGCTHYPLIKKQVQGVMGNVGIVDSAGSTAESVKKVLVEQEMLVKKKVDAAYKIYLTDYTDNFKNLGEIILEREISDFKVIELTHSKGEMLYTVM